MRSSALCCSKQNENASSDPERLTFFFSDDEHVFFGGKEVQRGPQCALLILLGSDLSRFDLLWATFENVLI